MSPLPKLVEECEKCGNEVEIHSVVRPDPVLCEYCE